MALYQDDTLSERWGIEVEVEREKLIGREV
jgi:hypothetical protein